MNDSTTKRETREQLQVIETGHGPQVEASVLVDVLTRDSGLVESIVDPLEVQAHPTPLAPVNAYRHRMQALRCEYLQMQLRMLELEKQLAEARALIGVDASFEQVQSSFAWKIAIKCFRFWWRLSRRLRNNAQA